MTKKISIQESILIGNVLIEEVKKLVDWEYKGKYKPYIDKYVNKLRASLEEDTKDFPQKEYEECKQTLDNEIEDEIMYIECFCKFLEEEQEKEK